MDIDITIFVIIIFIVKMSSCRICCNSHHTTSNCNDQLILETHTQALISFRIDYSNPSVREDREWIYSITTRQLLALALHLHFPISWNQTKLINAIKRVYYNIIRHEINGITVVISNIVQEVKESISHEERRNPTILELLQRDRLIRTRANEQLTDEFSRRRVLTDNPLQDRDLRESELQQEYPLNNSFVTPRSIQRERNRRDVIRRQANDIITMLNQNYDAEMIEHIRMQHIDMNTQEAIQQDVRFIYNQYQFPLMRSFIQNEEYRAYIEHRHLLLYYDILTNLSYHNYLTQEQTLTIPRANIQIVQMFNIQLSSCHKKDIHNAEDNICSICYDSHIHNSCITNCNHNFCVPCIIEYLKHNYTNNTINCPTCRTDIIELDVYTEQAMDSINSLVI
jgi:hypothetical protein